MNTVLYNLSGMDFITGLMHLWLCQKKFVVVDVPDTTE
jgi:hypothetical protein